MARNYNRITGSGYTGIPAQIFYELGLYGKEGNTYEVDRKRLHKIYGYLKAFLPNITYLGKDDDYNKNIHPYMEDAYNRTEKVRTLYKSMYESKNNCNDEEKAFQKEMDGLFETLVMMITISKVIDQVKPEAEEYEF